MMDDSTTDNASPEQPASALASLEKVAASSAVDTSASGSPETTPATAAATVQPTPTGQAAPSAATRGPIPFDRHEASLKNAREESRQEAIKELTTRYGWADGLNPQEVQTKLGIIERLYSNPKQFLVDLAGELGIGKQPQEEELKEPDPDLVSDDGKFKTYSNATLQKLMEVREQRLVQRLMEQFRPLLQDRELSVKEKAQQAIIQQTTTTANKALEEARKLPHFKELEKEVGTRLQAMPKEQRQEMGSIAAMYLVYNQVLAERGPSIGQTAEQKVLGDMRRKANATGVVPSGGEASAVPTKPTNVTELAAHLRRLTEQASA